MENTTLISIEKTGGSTGQLRPVSSPAKYIYIIFGMFFFGLGVVGTILPLIPTTPLIILAAVCFGKSSRKLHLWCVSTKFYQNNVESFVKKRTMALKAKIILLTTITAVMGISFITMVVFSVPMVAKIALFVVWLFHMVYFGFMVKVTR